MMIVYIIITDFPIISPDNYPFVKSGEIIRKYPLRAIFPIILTIYVGMLSSCIDCFDYPAFGA